MCEHFHCLPHEAIEAIEADTNGLLFHIITLRAFAEAKKQYESIPADKRKNNPMLDLVSEFTMGDAKEKIKRFLEAEKAKDQ